MKQAVPAVPLLVLTVALAVIALSAWLVTLPVEVQTSHRDGATSAAGEVAREPVEPVGVFTAQAIQTSKGAVQNRSPFIADRSAFSRTPPRRPAPPPPEHKPELVGIFGKGEARAAMIVWKPGESAVNHTIGSSSPWGVVEAMAPDRVVFKNETGKKTLSLFGEE